MDGPNQVCAWRSAEVYPGISCIDNRKPGERYVVDGGCPTLDDPNRVHRRARGRVPGDGS